MGGVRRFFFFECLDSVLILFLCFRRISTIRVESYGRRQKVGGKMFLQRAWEPKTKRRARARARVHSLQQARARVKASPL